MPIKHKLSPKTEKVEWLRIIGLVCLFSISITLLLAFMQTVDLIKEHNDKQKLRDIVGVEKKLRDLKIKELQDLIKNHCNDDTLDVNLQDLIENYCDDGTLKTDELQSLIDSHRNHYMYKYVPLVCAIVFAILIFTRRDLDWAKFIIAFILTLIAACPFAILFFSSTIGLGEL